MGNESDERVELYDTTLRDGTQREGISLSCDDKIRIAKRLDALGVTFIEGGWPGSNPKDVAFFDRAKEMTWQTATITAFGSTRRAGIAPGDDPSMQALIDSGVSVCTIFGKSSVLHVTEVLRTTRDENLAMIEDSVAWLVGQGRRVIYDAEHFFDGYRLDANYALATVAAAARGGAETVVLCDTNGGSVPWDVEETVRVVRTQLASLNLGRDVKVGIHAHNDGELAVANSLAAVRGGAAHVQGTINGYGERCGNANLCAIIPDLELKMDRRCVPEGQLRHLYELSHFVAEVANLSADEHMAYVGRSAFAHKGGVHVAAMRRDASSYQHIDPEQVGNRMRVVVSELSGRGNVLHIAEEFGLDVESEAAVDVLDEIKQHEAKGYSFEAAEASVALKVKRRDKGYEPLFRIVDYKVLIGHERDLEAYAEATVKVAIGDEIYHTASEGCGPVGALDAALRRALTPVYPAVERIHLKDYKVRILDGSTGTASTTRVLIDNADDEEEWSTVGASQNIIEASIRALVDGIEYGLERERARTTTSTSTSKEATL